MDRIAYDPYKINIRAEDPKKDRSMREVYGIRSVMSKKLAQPLFYGQSDVYRIPIMERLWS